MVLIVKLKVLLIFTLIIFYGCKKEEGQVFLRVIQPADTNITSLTVSDANGTVPVDGNYHEVFNRIELSYVLKNMLKYEVLDWNPQMVYDQYTYSDYSINEYLGEFEKIKKDGYYTLNISYFENKSDAIYSKPIYTQWGTFGDYYFYSYNYLDNTILTFSLQE